MTILCHTDTFDRLRHQLRTDAVRVPLPRGGSVQVLPSLVSNEQYVRALNALRIPQIEDGFSPYLNIHNPSLPIKYDARRGHYTVRPTYETHPVVGVPWLGARFVAESFGARLPTEAEWEHLASSGDPARLYPWGDSPPEPRLANYEQNVGSTTETMAYPPNSFGLYDMAGNAEEWCQDWHGDSEEGLEKVVKGGGWNKSARSLEICARRGKWYVTGSVSIGFRLLWDR